MAVEQRIGRVHRYGQRDTVQVYNLLAENTVEEQIYGILEGKLLEIARSIGHTDESGQLQEDFRWDILGFLGSRPDYQDLYKRALVDRDYRRTEEEVQRMIQEAVRAREALSNLTQDFSGFNLEHYKKLEGRYSMAELGEWVREGILRLGGAVIPEGEFWALITPEPLKQKYHLAPRYEKVCFDRGIAMRARGSELGGIGHPLVNALVEEILKPSFQGGVSADGADGTVYAHYLVKYKNQKGHIQGRVLNLSYNAKNGQVSIPSRFQPIKGEAGFKNSANIEEARERIESALQQALIEWLPDRQFRASLQVSLIGLHAG